MGRNTDTNVSREMNQAPEGDGSAGQETSESRFLRRRTQVPPCDSSPNRNTLARRECEVVRLLAEGKSNKEIAPLMNITVKTVETYRERIMSKLGIHSLAQLIRYAAQNGLVRF